MLKSFRIGILQGFNHNRACDTARQHFIFFRRNTDDTDVAGFSCLGAAVVEGCTDVCYITGTPLSGIAHRNYGAVDLCVASHIDNAADNGAVSILLSLWSGLVFPRFTLKCGARIVASCIPDVFSKVASPVKYRQLCLNLNC